MPKTETQAQTGGATSKLQAMAERFAPTEITADVSRLAPADRQVLAKLVQASKIMDALFMRQVWAGNEAMLLDLVRDETPEGRARLHYFLINKGPWSRLDHNEIFVPGAPPKPEAANFYPNPAGMSIPIWKRCWKNASLSSAVIRFTPTMATPNPFTTKKRCCPRRTRC